MTNVLASLLELGIVDEIQDAETIDITFSFRYTQKLMDFYGISEENAATGVYMWCEYYGHQVLGKVSDIMPAARDEVDRKGKLYQDLFSFQGAGARSTVTGCNDKNALTLVVPAKIQGQKMRFIGEAAFRGMSRVEQAVIPEGLEEIGKYAFADCRNLKQTILPYGISKIGAYAFAESDKLVTVNIPETVRTVGDYAFENTFLREVIFPGTILNVGKGLYKRCKNLTKVVLPDNMREIPDEMFAGCEKLEGIKLPDRMEKIGSRAFADCKKMPWIQFPSSIQYMAEDALDGVSRDFIIICDAGSVAEKYAREHRIKYQVG